MSPTSPAHTPQHWATTNLEVDASRTRIFALQASTHLGEKIAQALGTPLARHEERDFEDGEHKTRPLDSVRDADVYIVQSLHAGPSQSANDKLCRLLFFIGAVKDAGASRITAVVPYLCYARKDRRTKTNDPVTTRYVANLFEAVGTDVVVALDVHNPVAFENAFRCRTVTLTAAPSFVSYVRGLGEQDLCVVSPDPGGVKRAELFREALEEAIGRPVRKGFADKHRSAGVVSGDLFVGDVLGATVLIMDDLISSGNTLRRAAHAVRKAGAQKVLALVTHGLFMSGTAEVLADAAIDRFVVTDSVPPFRLKTGAAASKIDTIQIAPLLAEAIVRLQAGRSLADLLVF